MNYEIIVVGGGHAGCEASLAAARIGHKTLLVTGNIKNIGDMPCNPSIGGSAKGIVVREIDALGGEMGKNADKSQIQMKMLNYKKGPAIRALRAQADKVTYPQNMWKTIENQANLDVKEGLVEDLIVENDKIKGVILEDGTEIYANAVILTTGTYLKADILVGDTRRREGPHGERPSNHLSDNLRKLGFEIKRLKTGTPQRIDVNTIDFSKTREEKGSDIPLSFSFDNKPNYKMEDQVPCHLIYTTEETHKIIRDNLTKSSMYGGLDDIEGIGPRYCPSIEDKVVRFASKTRHQLFLEPESTHFESCYVQGLSTSFSKEIQEEILHSIVGLEKARVLKYAYAIEYDSIEPSELTHSLSLKKAKGIFIAGQIASTSGYEEAAALGLMAGINAYNYLKKKEEFILSRDEAYIGIMIDDIVTKGSNEPYRLLSSRSEFRLLTRNDNADIRLLKKGYDIGLNSKERYQRINSKNEKVFSTIDLLDKTKVGNNKGIVSYISSLGFPKINGNETLKQLLKRQNVSYIELSKYIQLPTLSEEEVFKVETEIKYEGFIKAELIQAERRKNSETTLIPEDIDYLNMDGISLEAREKLNLIKPRNLGEASRITNVHPADIDVLYFYIKRLNKSRK